MRPDPEMMLACDCQGSLGIGLEIAQGTFAVVGSRQKVLAARCRFELIVRRWVLEFRKWICRGHRNSRAPTDPAPVLKSLTPLQGNRKRAGALRQHVRFGSKADICNANRHVRFSPNSDGESEFPQKVMSALPPKADMCRTCARALHTYSITSSAIASTPDGIARPSVLAVLRLSTNSNLVDCM